jgi:hypothetical protein
MLNSDLYKIVSKHIVEHDGKVVLCKGEYCSGYSKCYGVFYFDSKDRPIIKVATGKKTRKESLGILVHEYSHFLQWSTNCKLWQEFENAEFNFQDVISNPQKNKKNILLLLKLELDCEKRSVRLIKKNNLLDDRYYCKVANSILYKYAYLYLHNKWPTNSMVGDAEILNSAPEKLLARYEDYFNIPEDIINKFSF